MDLFGIYGLTKQQAKERGELIEMMVPYPIGERRASGGWKQRLALVCALLHRPRMVFLDEPTAGVDPVARRDLWDLLFRLSAEGITLFVTTHYMDEAERCGRVGYLYMSKLLAIGTPDELKQWPGVTPDGTHRLEITGVNVAALLARLRHRRGVHEATIFGETVRALVDADLSPHDLDLDGYTVRETTPSLEDVFVTPAPAAAGNNMHAVSGVGRSVGASPARWARGKPVIIIAGNAPSDCPSWA